MKSITTTFLVLAAAAFVLGTSMTAPADAAARTWVAGGNDGNDSNPCTRASPCSTFAHALSVTDPFGEINCLTAGSFGFVSISQSVTISCEGGTAGILAAQDGIFIFIGENDSVYLKGLDIGGVGPNVVTQYGILFDSPGELHIDHCLIHSFSNTTDGFTEGVFFEPTGNASLFVSNTVFADNGSGTSGGNIVVTPGQGAKLVNVALKNVRMEGGSVGLKITDNASTTIHAVVEDSSAVAQTGDGFLASTTGGRVTMLIDHSTAANNGQNGIEAIGANVEIDIGNSKLYGNGGSTATSGGGPTLLSFGNNEIIGNGRNAAIATTSPQ